MSYRYHYHKQPGCGGCLLVMAMLALVFGGAPMLLDLIGFIFFSGLFLMFLVVAGIWGFGYYMRRKVSEYEQNQSADRNKFVSLLVHILVRIAQFDGKVTRAELQTITNFFRQHLHYNQQQIYWVKELIKDAFANTDSLESLLLSFRQSFAYEPRLILVEMVYQVLFSNSHVTDQELQLARNIGEYLDLSAYDLQAIANRYLHRRQQTVSQEDEYYDILGLAKGASMAEIKTAYRKLSMQYHPDKVGHLGEEFRNVAEDKMKDLNAAYQYFKERFA